MQYTITATIEFTITVEQDDWTSSLLEMWAVNGLPELNAGMLANNIKWCLEQEHHGIADYKGATVTRTMVYVKG